MSLITRTQHRRIANKMEQFNGKVVLITGSSSGIGAQTAVDFARAGAKVVITGRNASNLQETADRCRAAGTKEENIYAITGDVTQEADVDHIVDSAVQTFGTIHILVNNAGTLVMGDLGGCDIADIDAMYNVHIRAVVMVTKRALPYIIENKGSIINTSSVCGSRPIKSCLGYSVMKAGINQLTQCLALELAPKGVRVNAVAPGIIDTPLFVKPGAEMAETPDRMEEFYAACAEAHPLGRVGSVTEVSQAIQFLASDAASFTTGAILPVDGGRHATVANPAMLSSK